MKTEEREKTTKAEMNVGESNAGVVEEKVLLKIKRLLALSRSSNEHEAALAASKAQQLLFKYKIDAARIDGVQDPKHVGEKAEGREYDYAPKGKRTQAWRWKLLNSITHHNFCTLVILGKGEARTGMVIGKPSDIEVVTYVHGYLITGIDRLAKDGGAKAREHYRASGEHVDAFRWYMSFCDGACETVQTKLYDQKRHDEDEAKRLHGDGCVALVKRDEGLAEVKKHEMYPSLGRMKSTQASRDREAKMQGRAAGEKISLRRPISE